MSSFCIPNLLLERFRKMKILLVLIVLFVSTGEVLNVEEDQWVLDFFKLSYYLEEKGLFEPIKKRVGGIRVMKDAFIKARSAAVKSIEDYKAGKRSFWLKLGQWSLVPDHLLPKLNDSKIQVIRNLNQYGIKDDVDYAYEDRPNPIINLRYSTVNATPYTWCHDSKDPTKCETSIPSKVDWRLRHVVRFSPTSIFNSDFHPNCNASYPFAVAETIQAHLTLIDDINVDLSIQQFIDCIYDNDPRYQTYNPCTSQEYGFNGTPDAVVRAYKFAVLNGVMFRKSYPTNYYGGGQSGSNCAFNSYEVVSKIKGFAVLPKTGEVDLMTALAHYGPITVSIDFGFDPDFLRYGGGIYDKPCGKGKSLTMMLIGYGQEKGQNYWLLQNNWGDWGHRGYIKIARSNSCELTQQAIFPIIHEYKQARPNGFQSWAEEETKRKQNVETIFQDPAELELPDTPDLWGEGFKHTSTEDPQIIEKIKLT